jgi:hypothetical protein
MEGECKENGRLKLRKRRQVIKEHKTKEWKKEATKMAD